MTFSEILTITVGLLCLEKRVSYQRLRKEFGLDDETLGTLRDELVVKRVAIDEGGKGLVFIGADTQSAGGSHVAGSASVPAPGIAPPAPFAQLNSTENPADDSQESGAGGVATADAERRQLTVMFCDLVGSTALSTQLDPEDLREVITNYQDACREAIARYDGFIARYMGDGILVYFGYPKAHEDDAERAVRAGLDILEAMPLVNRGAGERYGVELAVRVGIATGPVVVGDIIGEGAAEEAAVVGETPNLAARLEGVAQPGQVAIGPMTRRLVGAQFRLDDLGTHELKGIAAPVQVWRVLGEAGDDAASQSQQSASMPLVGRQEELGLLLRSWEGAREGRGQVVLVQGEAGVGKSRLVDALRAEASESAHNWISIRSSPYHTTSPLHPVAEQVKRACSWQDEDTAAVRLDKLEQVLGAQTTFETDEIVPLFAALLSLPVPDGRYAPLNLSPKEQRDATLDALAGWILALADARPVLMAWEDLHWADPSTVELLGLMLDQVPTAQVLMIGTYRPEFVPQWPARAHVTPISLSRLERPEVEAIAMHLAGGKTLPAPVLEHIATKADGVPLYVEELTRTMLEAGLLVEKAGRFELRGSLADMQIPETLQDSLMARLDRVPTLREVAQIGAVLGREFAFEMMQHLAPLAAPALQDGLGQLVEGELLYQRGRGRRARYVFKHALIQDAAYQSLLRRTRQQYHGRVAELLEAEFGDTVESHPELLAHHYSLSSEHANEAVEYWRRAADRALARGANMEAVSHLSAALEDVMVLEESPERHELELELQTKLGPAVVATRGFADPLVARCYARAQSLCEALGDTAKLALILRGQQLSQLVTGDMAIARALAAQLAEVTGRQGDTALRVGGLHALAQTNLFLGNIGEAIEHAELGIELFDPDAHRIESWPGGQPGEQCYLYAAQGHWLSGDPDAALGLIEIALEVIREYKQQFSLANLLALGAVVLAWRGDFPMVRHWCEESIGLCREHGIDFWLRFDECLLAWAASKEAPSPAAADAFERALAGYESLGTRVLVSALVALFAESCLDAGEAERGLVAVNRGLKLVEQNNERWMEAELHRLRAELLLASTPSRVADAEDSLTRALEVAHAQAARSLELRALVSLVNLRDGRADEVEARTKLAACYGQFAEGLGTADLRRAKSLLDGDRAEAS